MTDFVLIYRTGQGAAGWDRVVPKLAERRHTAHAVELPDDPNLTAADYAELISQQVGDLVSPVVLAHSGSGPLLPAAARRLGARRQVWLAAWVPMAAMLGHVDVVRAMLDAQPPIVDAIGPHGIPLAAHAEMGGESAQAVSELLAERSRYAETG